MVDGPVCRFIFGLSGPLLGGELIQYLRNHSGTPRTIVADECACHLQVHYSYGQVVSTLAAVEDSNPDIYVRIDANPADVGDVADADDDVPKPNGDDDVDAEPALAGAPGGAGSRVKPITSKIRTTVKHLRARAGPWSMFRGLKMAIVYGVLKMFIVAVMPLHYKQFLGQFVMEIVSEVLLANLSMAWVHIVISEPSTKRFYQRIPGFKSWTRIAPVAALKTLATGVAFYLPLGLVVMISGWDAFDSSPELSNPKHVLQLIAIIIVPSLCCFLVAVPAHAIFIRVAASMLPEEDEAIVPFDRSFGGKVVPAILGGSGMVGIKDAWTTFDWPARVRFVKICGKVLGLECIVLACFALTAVGQVYMVGADAVNKLAVTAVNSQG